MRPNDLPVGWDREADEAAWPETLISAIRIDIAALASPRAITTVRAWRAALRGAEPARGIAAGRLARVAEALVSSEPVPPIPNTRFATLALRRGVAGPDRDTASAPSERGDSGAHSDPTWVPDDSPELDPLLSDLAGPPLPRRSRSAPARPAPSALGTVNLTDPDEMSGETAGGRPPRRLGRSTAPPPFDDDEGPTNTTRVPATKDLPPPPSAEPPRPRASMIQVRALYAAVAPLCRELVPLTYERRSRRFWTHWREVSGERGVHRGAAERILETASDFRALATELIAEVLGVDLDSVSALVARIDGETPVSAQGPRATQQRPRGPLLGASVSVASDDDDGDDA